MALHHERILQIEGLLGIRGLLHFHQCGGREQCVDMAATPVSHLQIGHYIRLLTTLVT